MSCFLLEFLYDTGFAVCFRRCTVVPLRSDLVSVEIVLTGEEWDCVQLLPPVVGDLDAAVVGLALAGFESLAVGMEDEFSDIVRVEGIQDVEVVGAIRLTALGKSIRQEALELGIIFELLLQVLYAEFVESGDIDPLDVRELEQGLLLCEDEAEVILVQHPVRRDVELSEGVQVKSKWELTARL